MLSDHERKNIIQNTLAALKGQKLKKVSVRISGVQTTIDKLRANHIAILTGKAGAGKTTTVYQVMCEMSNPSLSSTYTPVLIKSPEQWDKVINPTHQYLVYLDDVFGSSNLDPGAIQKWKNQLDIIFSSAKTGKIYVLIGLRRNVLNEAKMHVIHEILDEENIVDLSLEENLTKQDKSKIIEAYECNCNFKASELCGERFAYYSEKNGLNAIYKLSLKEKEKIHFTDSYYGFPLTCFQFFTRPDFFQLGPSYFQRPDKNIFKAIETMRQGKCGNISDKVKYSVLCYTFINGSVETNIVSETLLKTISGKLHIFNITEVDLKDAINDLNGIFLSKSSTEHFYKFSHETILEAVMVSFGQLAPDIVINHCSRRKLHELIRTENYEPKPCEVILKIPRRHYEDLAQRLLRGDDGDGKEIDIIPFVAIDILLHSGCQDPEFVSILCNWEMTERLFSLFHYLLFTNRDLIFHLLQ
ncbi:uncharacterized protein LOC134244475 [Saccostrea cucullata]|uniref:uncharacterized protein LOC134244475 n=1 Tax=Saccostrea cuccullata TaxID=36930 RepID=UPI002ED3979D